MKSLSTLLGRFSTEMNLESNDQTVSEIWKLLQRSDMPLLLRLQETLQCVLKGCDSLAEVVPGHQPGGIECPFWKGRKLCKKCLDEVDDVKQKDSPS
ncbi:hypothetical protein TURU_149042 [Turdus rufiventris]|nr:hypothetical protein TURU_149042 [Turdus rufiventris]